MSSRSPMDNCIDKALVKQFRDAVASGEFARAEQLWNSYAAQCLAEKPAMRAGRLREMRELMEWTRVTVLCFRSHALRKLRTRLTGLHAAGAYARASSRRV